MTVGEWLDIWVSEYLKHVKPLTQETYAEQVQRHLKPSLGATKLEDLDTHTIQRFYNRLSADGLAPKTIKNIHGVLHCALQQAISNDYIRSNPTTACKLPKIIKPEIKPLEPNEIRLLLQEAEQDSYYNLFVVAMFTGMRQGELLGLSWENVNFLEGTITVRQQLQCKNGKYFLETPKTGKYESSSLPRSLWKLCTLKNKSRKLINALVKNYGTIHFTLFLQMHLEKILYDAPL